MHPSAPLQRLWSILRCLLAHMVGTESTHPDTHGLSREHPGTEDHLSSPTWMSETAGKAWTPAPNPRALPSIKPQKKRRLVLTEAAPKQWLRSAHDDSSREAEAGSLRRASDAVFMTLIMEPPTAFTHRA
ncbi:hypothetical protein K491DRAFT_684883 [Lophiostoma macrostomum CBS 122681]|uniref:Secreted protein n=1 Tax=Lophiostoma macrostomum CBS 122681 TaxID=1314788 RepID=A0A6A6SPW6_9PLEO|nr:hypothetical protein K491DRAFT_684883 [Lophiostoma macrostomum CBS 122681]